MFRIVTCIQQIINTNNHILMCRGAIKHTLQLSDAGMLDRRRRHSSRHVCCRIHSCCQWYVVAVAALLISAWVQTCLKLSFYRLISAQVGASLVHQRHIQSSRGECRRGRRLCRSAAWLGTRSTALITKHRTTNLEVVPVGRRRSCWSCTSLGERLSTLDRA